MKHLANNQGYTLVEMLLVLSIFMMIVSLGAALYLPFVEHLQRRFFFTQLTDDLYQAQEYAITHQTNVHFQVNAATEEYFAYSYADGYLFRKKIPEDVQFKGGTLANSFSFTGNGNVSAAGTWILSTPDELFQIIMNIGSGRFRLEKH